MAEEKNLPLPEKELPPPHDMQLDSGGHTPPTSPTKPSAGTSSFWDKYGSKKWLLPLILVIVILVLLAGTAAFMGTSKNTMTRSEKRQERQEKRQQKQKKNNKNKKKRNNNKNGKAKTSVGTVSFTYGTGPNKIAMQYPNNMKVNISNDVSTFDSTKTVPLITFAGNKNIITMKVEPNPNSLSAASWQSNLAKKSDTFATPTENITVAQKNAVLQHVLTNTANWIAYVPMDGSMLYINMNYGGGKDKAKGTFLDILKTLQIGTQITPTISPSVLPTQTSI